METNKIHHGDFTEVMKTLQDETIDLIVVDPPYGVDFQKSKFYDDSKSHVTDKIEHWLSEMSRVLKDKSHIYIYIPTLEVDLWVSSVKKYFNFKNLIATQVFVNNRYNKDNFGWDLQMIIYACKGKPRRFNAVDWIPSSESWRKDKRNDKPKDWTYKYPSFISNDIIRSNYKNGSVRKRLHPNEKNDKLIENFIRMSTNEGEVVLDCFCGGGSTLLAAKNSNRKYIGIEQNIEYVNVSENRLNFGDGKNIKQSIKKEEDNSFGDRFLLVYYKKGFENELDGINTELEKFGNELEEKSYKLGVLHASVGDGVRTVDYLSDEEILKEIKDEKNNN